MRPTAQRTISRRTFTLGLGLAGAMATVPAFAKAPLMGKVGHAPSYRGKLGSFEITAIHDGGFFRKDPYKYLAINAEQADVAKVLTSNFYPEDRYELSIAPAIVNTGSQVILFDTGIGAVRRPAAGQLKARLAVAGLTPEQVDVVVLSHFHVDHTGGLMEAGKPTFPNARYVTDATEYDFWTKTDSLLNSKFGVVKLSAKVARETIVPLADRFTFIKPGQDVVTGITAIKAYGHTPGHLAFNVESEGKRLVLAADTAVHPAINLERPDWHMIFDFDAEEAVKSRKSLFGMIAADRVPFSGYHMGFPNIGYVEARGSGFRYSAANYQLSSF